MAAAVSGGDVAAGWHRATVAGRPCWHVVASYQEAGALEKSLCSATVQRFEGTRGFAAGSIGRSHFGVAAAVAIAVAASRTEAQGSVASVARQGNPLHPRWRKRRRGARGIDVVGGSVCPGGAARKCTGGPSSSVQPPLEDSDELGQIQAASLWNMTRQTLFRTVAKVAFWSCTAVALSLIFFPWLSRCASVVLVGVGGPTGLSDAAQNYVGHFLALMSLLFSILAGNSYAALYSQNEAIFYSLFAEVSEAKALMEQAALVCSGRPFYRSVLANIKRYVDKDLRRLDLPPAVLLSIKPRDDPLESILYLTSVGVPSVIYETVKSLRQRRGQRLGAVQRKLPVVQIVLLYVLGALTLTTFLLFSCAVNDSERWLCRTLFSLLSGALIMTMRVIHELWKPIGGAYNVDGVLAVMVRGLESELDQRLRGKTFGDTRLPSPPPRWQAAARRASPSIGVGAEAVEEDPEASAGNDSSA